jgi:transcriptional regulator with XRE-family HTH domain
VDKIKAMGFRNPDQLIRKIGERLKRLRLTAGYTQDELAERAGVSVSTLKLLERTGKGSLQRLAKIAVVLNVDGELRTLFEDPGVVDSLEAVARMDRKRAPRRKKGGNA